jgi:hypothetical protein
VIRETRFVHSHKPYAVDLHSLRGSRTESPQGLNPYSFGGWIDAVWFRGTTQAPAACIGELWDFQYPEPRHALEFLAAHTDGRYGADCVARWDGESFWGNVTLEQQEKYLKILKPMLENYPALPDGYDGWWTFRVPKGTK